MAEDLNNYPSSTPPQFPPAQPTQAFGQPNSPAASRPLGAPEVSGIPYGGPQAYGNAPRPYPAAPAAPVRKKGGSALVWILGGCGLIAVLSIVVVGFFMKSVVDQVGNSDLAKNKRALPTARQDLLQIRTALDQYTQTHEGQYPASLDKVVDAQYLSFPNESSGGTIRVEYTPVAPDAPGSSAIAGFYVGQMSMNIGQKVDQQIYLRLLKDGTIVREQVVRVPDNGRGF